MSAGVVAATVANANRGKSSKAFTPEDFIPSYEPPKKQTVEDQKAVVEQMKAALLTQSQSGE